MGGTNKERRTESEESSDIRDNKSAAVEFEEVLLSELKLFGKPSESKSAVEQALSSQLAGLALSGGGIRSATFCLGVIQALSKMGMLDKFHYLSTVSGGGYIGAWLQGLIYRQSTDGEEGVPENVKKVLHPDRLGKGDGGGTEAKEIRFLRQYSNYLTPKLGWFGADFWTVVAIYLRNFILNFLLIASSFAALMCACLLLNQFAGGEIASGTGWVWAKNVLAMAFLVFAFLHLWEHLRRVGTAGAKAKVRKSSAEKDDSQGVQRKIIFPILGAAILGCGSFNELEVDNTTAVMFLGILFVLLNIVFVGFIASSFASRRRKTENGTENEKLRKREGKRNRIWSLSFLLLFSISGVILLGNIGKSGGLVVFFPPIVLGIITIASFFVVGIVRSEISEGEREWWSRFNAHCLVVSIGWTLIMVVCVYGYQLVESGFDEIKLRSSLLGSWLAATAAGLYSARSKDDSGAGENKVKKLVATVAPYIFIAGLFFLLSWVVEFGIDRIEGELNWNDPLANRIMACCVGLTAALLVSGVLIFRMDVNRFSIHMLYRNRLVRCYLGASNLDRKQHPFTGFDENDDIELQDLASSRHGNHCRGRVRLYPIINTALNLVGGEELAWQKRKAGSFFFTPGFCGYEASSFFQKKENAFAETALYASVPDPLTLGTATGISGAAASPNMGYHTTPAAAFLLTFFNIRLGWWIGNPANNEGRKRSAPLTLALLFLEMFGLTRSNDRYVYLSDGGHFENLGIYELVRRRCRFILACDAEQDRDMTFDGLGNAIEKCRTDFGIEIDINVDQIRNRDGKGFSKWHWAVGTVDYGRPGEQGILVYIKSSLTGDAPEDILRYAQKNPEFPHQTTGDQWFDETQFESYRRLGQHIAEKLFENILDNTSAKSVSGKVATADVFRKLRDRWYPPSGSTEQNFSRHAKSVSEFFDELREDENLHFLSHQLYPEWIDLFRHYQAKIPLDPVETEARPELTVNQSSKTRAEIIEDISMDPAPAGSIESTESDFEKGRPRTFNELRSGFYFCNSLIQLMEEVYHDLNLESEFRHPDNRGWMNLFKHWAWSSMLKTTWTVSASTYGYRFQQFCERELDLKLGEIGLQRVEWELQGGCPIEATISDQEDQVSLNFYEEELASEYLEAITKMAGHKKFDVYSFTIKPELGYPPGRDDSRVTFTFGFCILDMSEGPSSGEICFFRIQDHLRAMGLCEKACEKLFERGGPMELRVYEDDMSSLVHEVPDSLDAAKFANERGGRRFGLALNSARIFVLESLGDDQGMPMV